MNARGQSAQLDALVDGQCKFLDDFARARGNNLRTEDLAVASMHHLDETAQVLLAHCPVHVIKVPASDHDHVFAWKAISNSWMGARRPTRLLPYQRTS
jgi:hypothetical protein